MAELLDVKITHNLDAAAEVAELFNRQLLALDSVGWGQMQIFTPCAAGIEYHAIESVFAELDGTAATGVVSAQCQIWCPHDSIECLARYFIA